MRPNLIVVRAGDKSLHRRWVNDTRARNFDLLVSYYGEAVGMHEGRADHYHAMRGPRWPAHDWLWRHRRDLFDRYERVAFVCDDVDADTRTWSGMFNLAEWFGLDLAQPAVTGHVNHAITRPVDRSLLRYTNFVEAMCPVFSRRALALCGDTFGTSVSGRGLDALWSARLPYPEYKVAIVDRLTVGHTSQTRIDPIAEPAALLERAGVKLLTHIVYGRLAIP